MMSWLVCEDVPDEYVPMMLEEMELDDTDARQVDVDAGEQARSAFPGRRHRLRPVRAARRHPAAGSRHPVHHRREERRPRRHLVREQLPGCRVDVGNHFYCYSFEPSDHWTEYFAQQPELAAYFRDVMQRARHRAAHPLEHRGHRRRLGRRRSRTWQVAHPRRGRHARRRCRRARSSPPSASSTARTSPTSKACTTSRARRSTRRTGITRSTTAARRSP